jgi:predicted dehydrogenase
LYCKPLQQLEKRGVLRVASLVDPVADHAAHLGKFFAGAATHREFEEALESSSLDLALILSPAHLHCDHVVQALLRDVHVLCEKPMASTADDCVRMQAVARERKRLLAIGMIRRYFPAFAELKGIIDDGRLGPLHAFEYREGHKFEWEVTTPAAFRPRAAGGTGVLFDIGPHVIDHLAWTFGDLQVTRYADDALAGIESNASMDVVSPACPGSIHLSWDSPQTNELRVFGAKGEAVLRIDRFDQLAVLGGSGFEPHPITMTFPADVRPAPASTMTPLSYPQAIYCQIVQMARAIELGESPAVDGESGRRTVAVLESALSIAEPLPMPWLDVVEQEAFARLHWRNAR